MASTAEGKAKGKNHGLVDLAVPCDPGEYKVLGGCVVASWAVAKVNPDISLLVCSAGAVFFPPPTEGFSNLITHTWCPKPETDLIRCLKIAT